MKREAAFHRGCSAWLTVIAGGSSCHSDWIGEGTGCWVLKGASQKEMNLEGEVHLYINLFNSQCFNFGGCFTPNNLKQMSEGKIGSCFIIYI